MLVCPVSAVHSMELMGSFLPERKADVSVYSMEFMDIFMLQNKGDVAVRSMELMDIFMLQNVGVVAVHSMALVGIFVPEREADVSVYSMLCHSCFEEVPPSPVMCCDAQMGQVRVPEDVRIHVKVRWQTCLPVEFILR